MLSDEMKNELISSAYELSNNIIAEIKTAVSGKDEQIKLLLCALFSGSHVLIEDVPGTGKTTLALAMSKAAGLSFKRAQFTPDVMASDITGYNMYSKKTESFEYREGLVHTNVFLADEINRASPKTQSALLEAMEEMAVTVDGVRYQTPSPFTVIATQNPSGFVGTYPLPEAQLDRFAIRLSMGYPSRDEELNILKGRKSSDPLKSINAAAAPEAILACKRAAEEVYVSPSVEEYIVDLVKATRSCPQLSLGASPRASLTLMRLSRALAIIKNRDHVLPEDVVFIYPYAISHRVVLSRSARTENTGTDDVIKSILKTTKIPFLRGKDLRK